MKKEIKETTKKLAKGDITKVDADKTLMDLFDMFIVYLNKKKKILFYMFMIPMLLLIFLAASRQLY
jgi:hypothetical protein